MKEKSITAYLLLGSNIGDRLYYLEECIRLLSEHFEIGQCSSIYETAAWGDREQQAYLNIALEICTDISPADLHQTTRAIEQYLGRKDKGNYQPRTLDIDILFYGEEIILSNNLTIPHPRLQFRRFVLVPLNEIAPKLIHPVFRKNIQTLLDECPDDLPVEIFPSDEKNCR